MDVLYDMIGDVIAYAESELSMEECNLTRIENRASNEREVNEACSIEDRIDALTRVIRTLEAAQGELEE